MLVKQRLDGWKLPTAVLDEIGNLPLSLQAKLLAALERREISRLGSTQMTPIDVRYLCATNADIHTEVAEGRFREDLFYRINTIEITIQPLRERCEDIILLAEHFLTVYAHKYNKKVASHRKVAWESDNVSVATVKNGKITSNIVNDNPVNVETIEW